MYGSDTLLERILLVLTGSVKGFGVALLPVSGITKGSPQLPVSQ